MQIEQNYVPTIVFLILLYILEYISAFTLPRIYCSTLLFIFPNSNSLWAWQIHTKEVVFAGPIKKFWCKKVKYSGYMVPCKPILFGEVVKPAICYLSRPTREIVGVTRTAKLLVTNL